MAMAPTEATHARSTGSRYLKLRCGVRGPNGLSRDQVVQNQRTRLFEAMVEFTATGGYQRTTVPAVCSLAGVSTKHFYKLFPAAQPVDLPSPKEACFLGAYDFVVDRAKSRIKDAYEDEQEPNRRLCRAFEQFAWEASNEPFAAQFALVETFGAGPRAMQRMERGREIFRGMIAASINAAGSGGEEVSEAVVRGIVGGVERVTRLYLREGRIGEFESTADELSEWVSSYRAWSPPAHATAASRRLAPRAARSAGKNEGLRILRAAAAIAASDGYCGLSAARIIRLAGVSEETFASLYNGATAIEDCFLAGFDLLGAEALVCGARASRAAGGWPDGVRSGITALLDHVARHPFLGRVAFIEVFSVGPSAIERRSTLLRRFADLFVKRIPDSQRPSELIAEAIVGGIWAPIRDCVVRGQVHRLHELADDATYLALTPVVGHDAAVQLILGDGKSVRPGRDLRHVG